MEGKINGCKNNPSNLSRKLGEHITSSFSMSAISLFKSKEDNHGICREQGCKKRNWKNLQEGMQLRLWIFKKWSC